MRLPVFELLGTAYEKITDFKCLDVFSSFDNDNVVIEFSDMRFITELILPLCNEPIDFIDKSEWYTARLVFSQNAISSVILENNSGECLTSDVAEMINTYISDMGRESLYCRYCSEIIEYVTFLLTM